MKTSLKAIKCGLFLLCTGLLFLLQACTKESETTVAPNKKASLKTTRAAGRILNVCYVEVNNFPISNVGKYTLANSGANAFDMAVIFAANINYDTDAKRAVLYFNDNVTKTLADTASIRALQKKGIKVTLSILGNHQGAGISNFPNQEAAADFAKQCADAVEKYHLDGIDLDDEYAEYGNNGTGKPNSSSFINLITELRSLMPSKLITFYYIGECKSYLTYDGVTAGSKLDYAWNPYYGSYSAPSVPDLGKSQLAAAAVDLTSTSESTAKSYATKTKSDGYGVYLCYNLTNTDSHTYISNITQALYGEDAVYTK